MDIKKELEALRARWPRVQWGESHNGFSKIHGCADGDVAVYLNYYADGWKVLGREGLADTAAAVVSAWVSSHPLHAFLAPATPAEPEGETVEVRGWVSVADTGEVCASGMEADAYDRGTEQEEADARVMSNGATVIAGYPFTLRIPKPKPAPMLVGEVETP